MTAQEALELANGVLKIGGEEPLSPPPKTGSDQQRVEAILNTYATRLREKRPSLQKIKDDRMLPDIVIQKIAAALSGNN
ncbi:MAG: hypothetical protein Q7J98_14120 [Kiritimatiellia bacterium]|nr:hypothetical protein [Kiritimatiellia bacterium]